MKMNYQLECDSEDARKVAAGWIKLGVASLVAAGLFSILLVLARTPAVQEHTPFADFFRIALVVHVNLSVLVWLLSIAGACWSLAVERSCPTLDRATLGCAAGGAGLLVAAPFLGAGEPLMNNYVPILRDPLFYTGLGLFILGIATHLVRAIASWRKPGRQLSAHDALSAALVMTAAIVAVAILAFVASLIAMPSQMAGQVYFEFLFWGAGHVLQFGYTLLMLVAWVVLASSSGCRFTLTPRLTLIYFTIAAAPTITVPFLYIAHDVASAGHRLAFTELMEFGGLSSLPVGIAVVAALWQGDKPVGEGRYLRSALESSIALFAVGGVLGFLIAGLDIVIPAHYHGSTVGVTIALMGLIFYLLPRLGFSAPHARMTFWQPYVYGGGQLMHIAGLAWTGGYGVQRKTAGAAQGLDRLGEILGMGLMGLGGLISVIGGVMFLAITICAMRRGRSTRPNPVGI